MTFRRFVYMVEQIPVVAAFDMLVVLALIFVLKVCQVLIWLVTGQDVAQFLFRFQGWYEDRWRSRERNGG